MSSKFVVGESYANPEKIIRLFEQKENAGRNFPFGAGPIPAARILRRATLSFCARAAASLYRTVSAKQNPLPPFSFVQTQGAGGPESRNWADSFVQTRQCGHQHEQLYHFFINDEIHQSCLPQAHRFIRGSNHGLTESNPFSLHTTTQH